MAANRADKKAYVVFEPERKALRALRVQLEARSDSAVVRRAIRALAKAKGIVVERRRFEQPET